MNSDNLTILPNNVDLTQIPSIHQKRIVAFVNHFVLTSIQFLNKFIANCESKFIDFERKVHKIEASLLILEAKLNSISGIPEKTTELTPIQDTETIDTTDKPVNTNESEVKPDDNETTEQCELKNSPPNGVKACEDARFRKYFKMMQFGVPERAVIMKMESEGYDSSILYEPNKILEDGVPHTVSEDN